MQKKFKWGFVLMAVATLLFTLSVSMTSCSDDGGGSSDSSPGNSNPNIIEKGETLSFDFDTNDKDASRYLYQVVVDRKLPLGVTFPIKLHHKKPGKVEQKVEMANANVRLVVVPGTGRAEMVEHDKDSVKATKVGNFTIFAFIFDASDTEIKNKTDISMADILNYAALGKIWGITQYELEGVAGSSAQKSLLSIVLAGASLSVKAGERVALPKATLYYSDGSSEQDSGTVSYALVGALERSEGSFNAGDVKLGEKGAVRVVSGQLEADTGCSDGTVQVYAEKDGIKSNNFTIAVKSKDTAEEETKNPLTAITLTKIAPTSEKVDSGATVKVKIEGTYRSASTKNLSSQMTFMANDYIDANSIIDVGTGNDACKQFTAPVTKVDKDITIQVVDSATGVMGMLTITVKGTGDSGVNVPGADDVRVQTATGIITMDFAAATGENNQQTAEDLKPQGDGGGGSGGGGTTGGTTIDGEEKKTVTAIPTGKKAIFVKADSAQTLWVWSKTMSTSELEDGKTAWPGGTMVAAGDYMNDGTGWFVKFFKSENIDAGDLNMHLNGGSAFPVGKMTGNKLYWDGGKATATDPTKAPDPEKPTITISPSSGKVPLVSTITVSISKNLSAIKALTFSIDGAVVSEATVTAANATSVYSVSKKVTKTAGDTISVSVSATNGVGTTTANATLTAADIKEDVFTWDNVYCYFVLTDRFNNGDTSNDHSYNRKNSGIPGVATFHGGDLKGLTAKIDYFDKLGVNAIWITAPYEQAHGWTDGKDGAFPHYSFHGYYTMDWTSLDANMGTLEEYREFVNACHSKGIRVVMDVVMNHTGYNTVEDMITYDFGGFKGTPPGHGWAVATGGKWSQGDGAGVDWASENWGKWWGCWVRAFDGKFGFAPNGSGDICMSLAGLPDVVTEKTDKVTIPAFLKKKWSTELTSTMANYKNPSVGSMDFGGMSGDWRSDSKGAPADYIVAWLSAWVRELGIDGFRCDTAKHVHMNRWGQLKTACEAALAAWRADSTKAKTSGSFDGSAAATWTQKFWMTGECFGWSSTSGQGDYYSTGKFDSMINFSFNGVSGSKGHAPTTSDWGSYVNINKNQDSDGNGNRNSVLSYVSSHDTGLHRSTGSIKLGTMLGLLPGGVQIYYGDETDRPECDGGGDADMKTRGDMNFLSDTDPKIVHWSRIGKFRKNNPAVGAGTGDAFHRSYKGNEVYIAAGNTVTLPSGEWWNWYTGTKVTGSSVTGTVEAPALISNKEYQ